MVKKIGIIYLSELFSRVSQEFFSALVTIIFQDSDMHLDNLFPVNPVSKFASYQSSKPNKLLSYCCSKNLPLIKWLKAMQIYSWAVLEGRGLKSDSKDWSKGSGEPISSGAMKENGQLLEATDIPCTMILVPSSEASTYHLNSYHYLFCHWPPCLPSKRTLVFWIHSYL